MLRWSKNPAGTYYEVKSTRGRTLHIYRIGASSWELYVSGKLYANGTSLRECKQIAKTVGAI